jgi:hypothetical protein
MNLSLSEPEHSLTSLKENGTLNMIKNTTKELEIGPKYLMDTETHLTRKKPLSLYPSSPKKCSLQSKFQTIAELLL